MRLLSMSLTKRDLLTHLQRSGECDARDVASAFEARYSVAAMGLLRLVRQGLATRRLDAERGVYVYRLSARGQARLKFLESRVPGRPDTVEQRE